MATRIISLANYWKDCAGRWSLVYLFLLWAPLGRAAEARDELVQVMTDLATEAGYSLVEVGGSKGSYGTTVGLGLTDRSGHPSSYGDKVLGLHGSKSEQTARRWLQVSAMRGTPWPIDLGVSIGQLQGTNTSRLSAIGQATVFEMLGWPAFTLRYQHSELLGLYNGNEIKTDGLELSMTQGIWRYFTGYVSTGVDQSQIRLVYHDYSAMGLDHSSSWEESQTVQLLFVKAGLQITAWPPFVQLIGEGQADHNRSYSLSFKLNVLI